MNLENQTAYCVSESVVFRPVMGEFVVIHIESGKIYYFNPSTELILSFFRTPLTFLDAYRILNLNGNQIEVDFLDGFLKFLISENILIPRAYSAEVTTKLDSKDYLRPEFIRMDPRTLSDVVFLCP